MPQRLLIVDDSSTMRLFLRKVLKLTGLELERVDEAADGAAALACLRSAPYDLVLADLNMPGMDGRALVKAVAADPDLKHVPVVVVSSEGDQKVLESLIANGAREVLRKPCEPVLLRKVILQAVGASQA